MGDRPKVAGGLNSEPGVLPPIKHVQVQHRAWHGGTSSLKDNGDTWMPGQSKARMPPCVHNPGSHTHAGPLPDSRAQSSAQEAPWTPRPPPGPRPECGRPPLHPPQTGRLAVSGCPQSPGPLPALTSRWDNSSPGFFSWPPSGPATTLLFFILLIESFILLKVKLYQGLRAKCEKVYLTIHQMATASDAALFGVGLLEGEGRPELIPHV